MGKDDKFKIKVEVNPRPKATNAPLKQVQAAAKKAGHKNTAKLKIAGVTVPTIRVDQRKLQFEQRRGAKGTEFRLKKGVLKVTGRQVVVMVDSLSACARKIWLKHEMDHVRDNELIFKQLEAKFLADPHLKSVYVDREWLPKSSFSATGKKTQKVCGDIFRKLVVAAIVKRDTAAEYSRVRKKVKDTCGGQSTKAPSRRTGE